MNWSPASGRKELETALRRIGGLPEAEIDIAPAALILAALDRPRVSLDRYAHHLSLLARDTADLGKRHAAEDTLKGRLATLRVVLFERYGYCGDQLTYDDMQNANLMRVIDRRKGLPVTLGILLMHAARSQGWAIEGLNFPGHFLLRMDLAGERAIIDPFAGATERGPRELRDILRSLSGEDAELRPEYTAPVSSRDVLLRLQNNIKLRLLQQRRLQDGLGVVESMLMIAPERGELWREAGLLHAELDNLRAAAMALTNYAELAAGPEQLRDAAMLLQKVKTRLN